MIPKFIFIIILLISSIWVTTQEVSAVNQSIEQTRGMPIIVNQKNKAPAIVPAVNITYQEGHTGFKLSWDVLDETRGEYAIILNEDVIQQEGWKNNTTIELNVDGYPIGEYIFMIRVKDDGGLSRSSYASVTVVSSPTTTSTTSKSETWIDKYLGDVITRIIAAVVSGIILILVRRRIGKTKSSETK